MATLLELAQMSSASYEPAATGSWLKLENDYWAIINQFSNSDSSEIIIYTSLDGSKEALISLEFLSWFIRDQARSGKLIQLRTFALPPMTPKGLQLGQTLTFHIDYFVENAPDSLAPILEEIASINHVLQTLISLYEIPCKMDALDTK